MLHESQTSSGQSHPHRSHISNPPASKNSNFKLPNSQSTKTYFNLSSIYTTRHSLHTPNTIKITKNPKINLTKIRPRFAPQNTQNQPQINSQFPINSLPNYQKLNPSYPLSTITDLESLSFIPQNPTYYSHPYTLFPNISNIQFHYTLLHYTKPPLQYIAVPLHHHCRS